MILFSFSFTIFLFLFLFLILLPYCFRYAEGDEDSSRFFVARSEGEAMAKACAVRREGGREGGRGGGGEGGKEEGEAADVFMAS